MSEVERTAVTTVCVEVDGRPATLVDVAGALETMRFEGVPLDSEFSMRQYHSTPRDGEEVWQWSLEAQRPSRNPGSLPLPTLGVVHALQAQVARDRGTTYWSDRGATLDAVEAWLGSLEDWTQGNDS